MIHRERIENEFEKKRDEYVDFTVFQKRDLESAYKILLEICGKSSTEIIENTGGIQNLSTIPTTEIDGLDKFAIEFGESWENHQQAREWAGEILADRTTFAADGSQYYSERETSMPIGAVQIGWFENPHNADKAYEKDAEFSILTPKELLENSTDSSRPDARVNEKRFSGEVGKIAEFLGKKKGWRKRGEPMPLAFFDGTLLVSFSLPYSDLQKKFVLELTNLVRLSREVGVPFVGYIDRSLSRDIVNLVNAFGRDPGGSPSTIYDTMLLNFNDLEFPKLLGKWGDRTPFCFSRRKGLESFIDAETDQSLVGFTYLQTTGDSLPARLDAPSWVFEDGLLDEISDVVRAECVIGLGYPYPLETADSAAVITTRDRRILLSALQDFAKKNSLNLSFSRKDASKGRRR